MTRPDIYFYPSTLLHWLSFIHKLEALMIYFLFLISNNDVETRIVHTPIMAPVAHPNLHRFTFRGLDTYLEAFVHQIIIPRLEKLEIDFVPSQLTFSVPRLQQLINTTENLRFDSAKFKYSNGGVDVKAYSREGMPEMPALSISVDCWHLDWQVSFSARLFNLLSQMFSAVEHLAFEREVYGPSFEEHNEVDGTEWHKPLRSFKNVKTLRIAHGLVKDLSLFVCNWMMENSFQSCCPSFRSSHILEVAIPVMDLRRLSTFARM